MNRMAESSRSLYNVEEVLNLLEGDPDDDEELDEVFFPGSDDELGVVYARLCQYYVIACVFCTAHEQLCTGLPRV